MAKCILPSMHTQVLVIGGGPAGAYSAAMLARDGFQVTVLEAARFPRYHVGESTLPSIRSFLSHIGALEKVQNHGFIAKPGGGSKFTQCTEALYININASEGQAWQVNRAEFDELLLNHAVELGAIVFQEHKVVAIDFHDSRPVSVEYQTQTGESGRIGFDYLIDASGRQGIMSTKYLCNRRMSRNLQNIACWAYWRGGTPYGQGTHRENATFAEVLADKSGWAWYISLGNSTYSVGFVVKKDICVRKRQEGMDGLTGYYLSQLQFVPAIKELLGDAVLVSDGTKPGVQSATDYSYTAAQYAGPHYRVAGDASAFVDPFFSTGVHLAMSSALSAAASVAASIRGQCTEDAAIRFHQGRLNGSYARTLLMVTAVYNILSSDDLLSDAVNKINSETLLDPGLPVFLGYWDAGSYGTSTKELDVAHDFLKTLVKTPAKPDQSTLSVEEIDQMTDDEDMKVIMKYLYAGTSDTGGLTMKTELGKLGLVST